MIALKLRGDGMSCRKLMIAGSLALATFGLAACETTEGYRQKMTGWQGRTGDDLLIEWGNPLERSNLSDGRQVWSYKKRSEVTSGDYYRDESRQVTRHVKDKDGKDRTETITETYPVYVPKSTTELECTTRFILTQAPAQRIEDVKFEGNGCVAEEKS
jgi:hypothetical protein